MSLLRLVLTIGGAFYVALFLIQVVGNGDVTAQALAGVLLLCGATALTWSRDDLALKHYETGLIWLMVLGFLAYALLHALGWMP